MNNINWHIEPYRSAFKATGSKTIAIELVDLIAMAKSIGMDSGKIIKPLYSEL